MKTQTKRESQPVAAGTPSNETRDSKTNNIITTENQANSSSQPNNSVKTKTYNASAALNIPAELKARPQWVCWRFKSVKSGKPTKIPVDPKTGRNASTNNPATWATHEEALAASPLYGGIGFVFTENDLYCGVDLDNCYDKETKKFTDPTAQKIIAHLNSYTEFSQSGEGFHVIVQTNHFPGTFNNKKGDLEMYFNGRFFIMTGDHFPGTLLTVESRLPEITAVQIGYMDGTDEKVSLTPEQARAPVEDGSATNEKMLRLIDGDWQNDHPSQSEADLALCNYLARLTNGDAAEIDKRFRKSRLMRDKWDEDRGSQTYGERTISTALEGYDGARSQDGKPVVIIGGYLDEKSDEMVEKLLQSYEDNQRFYRRGDQYVWLNLEGANAKIVEYNQDSLRGELARQIKFQKITKEGPAAADPQLKNVRNILASPNLTNVPEIEAITQTPYVMSGGDIVTKPGFNTRSKIYYKKTLGLNIPDNSENPTAADREKAKRLLQELIDDFKFVGKASKANMLGFLITGAVLPMIPGNRPIIWISARQGSTGKTLLFEIFSNIHTGRDADLQTLPKSNKELGKKITASLMAGSTAIMLDNITVTVDHPVLAVAATTRIWQDRILGKSEMATCAQNAVIALNGNNLKIGGDIGRRCVPISLDAKTSRPEARTGFLHPDLIGWIRESRGELIWSILVLIRAWIVAGRPKDPKLPVMGSFECWSETIGGILYNAGIPEFLRNLSSFRDDTDEEAGQWSTFLSALHGLIASDVKITGLTAAQIAQKTLSSPLSADQTQQLLLPDALTEEKERRSGSFNVIMGKALRAKEETRFLLREKDKNYDIYLKKTDVKFHNAVVWTVVKEPILG